MATIHVQNISPQTSENEIRDFFSFCGKITALKLQPSSKEPGAPQTATVTFEKDAAAKTALLLDNTHLGASIIHVAGSPSLQDIAGGKVTDAVHASGSNEDIVEQEDKPRSRIVAEYLAHGYVLGDHALQKAIALDQKHGFSNKFQDALVNFDKKYGAIDKARGLDQNYGISDKASTGWSGLNSYFEKALGTPTGQRVRDFYSSTHKQVRDIHAEAMHLAELKKTARAGPSGASGAAPPTTTPQTAAPGPAVPSVPKEASKEAAPKS